MRALSALVGLTAVASLGTVAWWVYWFVSGSAHGAGCDLAYENAFPLGDLVMAGSVAATAIAVHRRAPVALTIGFLAAGMSLSLAGLDTAHNLVTGAFHAPIDVVLRKAVFAVVNGAVGISVLAILPSHAGSFANAPSGEVRRSAVTASVGVALGMALLAVLAWTVIAEPPCFADIERSVIGPTLPVGVLAACALGSVAARPFALAVAGVCAHTGLIALLFAILQGAAVDGGVGVALVAASAGLLVGTRRRP